MNKTLLLDSMDSKKNGEQIRFHQANSLTGLEWEECACDWCGSTTSELLFCGPDRLHGLPGTFQMMRCSNCGLIRQNPRLRWASLKNYYTDDYSAYAKLARDETSFLRRWNRRYGSKKRLRAIHKYVKTGKLLDVGFGSGLFLEAALESKAWTVTGIEPTKHAFDYVKKSLPVEVIHGQFTEAVLEPNTFDLVTLWNVLEHVPDPIDSIKKSNSILVNGGWLVLTIPNPNSMIQRLFGQYWVGWDLPRHLYIFPLDTLKEILNENGFDLVATDCLSTSYAMLGHSIEFWSQSWAGTHPRLRRVALRLYYSLLLRLLLLLPLWILDKLRQSTTITIFARKTRPIGVQEQ